MLETNIGVFYWPLTHLNKLYELINHLFVPKLLLFRSLALTLTLNSHPLIAEIIFTSLYLRFVPFWNIWFTFPKFMIILRFVHVHIYIKLQI